MRILLVTLTMGLVLCGAPRLYADDDAAMAAFEDGKELFNAGRFTEAASAFGKANKLKPNWKLLFNIGQSEAAAKRSGLALEAFERYLTEGGDDIEQERRGEVLAEVESLRKMVGSLEIRTPNGAVVTVDNVERGRTPLSGHVLVAAGVEHWVLVKRLDETIVDRMVRVSGGQTLVVEVDENMEPTASEQSPEPAHETEEARPLKTAGWVTVGVGGAMLIGGVITGGMALSLDKDLEKDCADGGCPPDLKGERDKLDTLGVATDVLIVIGSAATIAGIVMLVVDSKREEGDKDTALLPTVGPGFAGFSFERRF